MDIFLSSAVKNSNQIKNHIIMIINQMQMIIIIIIKIIDRIKKVNSCVLLRPGVVKRKKTRRMFQSGRPATQLDTTVEREKKREKDHVHPFDIFWIIALTAPAVFIVRK